MTWNCLWLSKPAGFPSLQKLQLMSHDQPIFDINIDESPKLDKIYVKYPPVVQLDSNYWKLGVNLDGDTWFTKK